MPRGTFPARQLIKCQSPTAPAHYLTRLTPSPLRVSSWTSGTQTTKEVSKGAWTAKIMITKTQRNGHGHLGASEGFNGDQDTRQVWDRMVVDHTVREPLCDDCDEQPQLGTWFTRVLPSAATGGSFEAFTTQSVHAAPGRPTQCHANQGAHTAPQPAASSSHQP